jgi:hypothetical protein
MNTDIEHLKYQIIAWAVAMNDAKRLAEVAQILQATPAAPEPTQKVRQFGGGKGIFPLHLR